MIHVVSRKWLYNFSFNLSNSTVSVKSGIWWAVPLIRCPWRETVVSPTPFPLLTGHTATRHFPATLAVRQGHVTGSGQGTVPRKWFLAPSVILNVPSLSVCGWRKSTQGPEEPKAPKLRESESLNNCGTQNPSPLKPTLDCDVRWKITLYSLNSLWFWDSLWQHLVYSD